MIVSKNKVISLFKKKTSIRLTEIEWRILDNICYKEKMHRNILLELIYIKHNSDIGFTSSVRLFSLLYLYKCAQKNIGKGVSIEKVLKNLQ